MENIDQMKKFKKDFNLLRNLIIENDPVGLIDGGAPNDEYDTCIFGILSHLENSKNKIVDGEFIFEIFEKEFSGMVDKNQCKIIAEILNRK